MVKINDNGVIIATKGDTIRMPIIITNNDGSLYKVQPLDEIMFGLKETYEDEECLIEQSVDNDELELVLSHEKTKELEVGKVYLYDIQITKENGDVITFLSGKLKVTPEVYDK